ncbi:MAG: hypothetical protein Q7V01_12240 [Vicinamibacterales bacterium]|nr:hypothetical protein [Vicinamibacterales bacterium]
MDLALGMLGVRLGEHLLHVGVGDPALFAVAAGKVGLTGQAFAVVSAPSDGAALEAAAAREGVLIEVAVAQAGSWPVAPGTFDVAVIDGNALLAADPSARATVCAEVQRAVRGGGRVLAISRRPRGWAGRLGFEPGKHGDAAARQLTQIMEHAGFGPVRFLADREGQTFVEALRSRPEARDIVPS